MTAYPAPARGASLSHARARAAVLAGTLSLLMAAPAWADLPKSITP